MRISYPCTANIENTIKVHNQKIFRQNSGVRGQCGCACGCKHPLKGGNCRSKNIVYRATVKSGAETRFYIGLCSTQFRFRCANHKNSFKGGIYKNDTELSKYVCGLKRSGVDYEISQEVIKRAQPIADGNSPICRLCLKEATAVVYALKDKACLNKRSQFVSSCRHTKKSLLKFYKF